MTIDEVTALMRWNVAMYSNSAKPLTLGFASKG